MFEAIPWRGLAVAVCALVILALPAAASAVLPGRNGKIVFISGRTGPDNDDSQAKAHLLDTIGTPTVQTTFTPTAGQHRHPTWSPDRTKVAYARGTPGTFATEDFDIYIHDLITGQVTPITTPGDGVTSDRPAWSPDGTRIAFENEVGNNVGQRDIFVHTVGGGSVNLTNTAGVVEGKPAWTPDSFWIYYHKGDPAGANTLDIVRRSADGGIGESNVLADPAVSEFQAAISSDGTDMCFTRGSGFNASAEVYTAPTAAPSGNILNLSDDGAVGDYNCTWSPDGRRIAYVKGTFTTGALRMANFPDDELEFTLTDDANNFDGNPDWAPDARPICDDVVVEVPDDTPTRIPLRCTDQGPLYEQTTTRSFVSTSPAKGTLGEVDESTSPPTVVYTPDPPNFEGTDTFEFNGFDLVAFAEGPATVTLIEPGATPPGGTGGGGTGGGGAGGGAAGAFSCAGRRATIVGTDRSETLTGTPLRDVIVARRGRDRVRGRGGSDIICTGPGNDTVLAGRGNDVARGGSGNDRISGESGRDRLFGNTGADRLRGGRGRDRLYGGRGRDILRGGAGLDLLRGGPGLDSQRQ